MCHSSSYIGPWSVFVFTVFLCILWFGSFSSPLGFSLFTLSSSNFSSALPFLIRCSLGRLSGNMVRSALPPLYLFSFLFFYRLIPTTINPLAVATTSPYPRSNHSSAPTRPLFIGSRGSPPSVYRFGRSKFRIPLRLSAVEINTRLIPKIKQLHTSLQSKTNEFSDIVKLGHTQTQDATPLTHDPEFSGYTT
ncbi:hypothetical protein LXL04_024838 [Taraxacum kok-saghyz]